MKIRSLLLGSVAAAGLSTGAFAADLGVLTSLDVCDALGLSGLTISSDTNCLQVSGFVSYEFRWGDSAGAQNVAPGEGGQDPFNEKDDDADAFGLNNDWYSKVEAWVKFVATADSDFGPAKAVIKIRQIKENSIHNEINAGPNGLVTPALTLSAAVGPADAAYKVPTGAADADGNALFEFYDADGAIIAGGPYIDDDYALAGGDDTGGVEFNEAYVSIGDSTVIMAGKKGTIMNTGDDVPLNFLGLFHSEKVDVGAAFTKDMFPDGGHVIQVVSDLGNGVSVGAGLEGLERVGADAGTAVGVISYAGDGIAAHATFVAAGVLDGTVENWGVHAGFTGTFDVVKLVAAIAADSSGYFNAVGSVSATFDMFTLAVSGEAVQDIGDDTTDYGVGGSISAAVTDGVSINLGGRWYHDASNDADGYQAAVQLVAAVTETITLTGEVGLFGNDGAVAPALAPAAFNTYYGAATVAWAPGGNFTSSLKGEIHSNGAYRATFKAAKTFD